MEHERISASDALGAALESVKREWEVFLLLVFFTTLVTMLYYWPTLDTYASLLSGAVSEQAAQAQMAEELNQHIGYLLAGLIPYMVVYLGAQLVWSRVGALGRDRALEGGVGALLRRSLWVFWRYLCLIGWMVLFLLVFFALFFAVMMVGGAGMSGLEQAQPSGAVIALLVPLYLVLIGAVMALVCLFYVAMHGEARDMRLPIRTCFRAMKGNLMRAAGLMFLAVLVYAAIAVLFLVFFGIALFGAAGIGALIGMVIFLAAGTALNFVFVGYGAYYATRLIPDLKS